MRSLIIILATVLTACGRPAADGVHVVVKPGSSAPTLPLDGLDVQAVKSAP